MIRIPADNKLLKELWIHASSNRAHYMLAYYNGKYMMSFSSFSQSIMTYEVEPIIKSMLGSKWMSFNLKTTTDGTPVFEEVGEDPIPAIETMKHIVGQDVKHERIPINPSKVSKTTINAVMGSSYKTRLRPMSMTKHYTELFKCDTYWWFHGRKSDFFVIRDFNPFREKDQASSQ